MLHLMHFRMLATDLGVVFAAPPIGALIRGLNRGYPSRKTARGRKQDLYYENGVAIPVGDLGSRF